MSGTYQFMNSVGAEIITEAATAEIALWTIAIATATFTVSVAVHMWMRHRKNSGDAALSLRCIRWSAVVAVFLILTVQVSQGGWLTKADSATLAWFVGHRTTALTTSATGVTMVFSPVGACLAAVVAAAIIAWWCRSWLPAAVVLGTMTAAAAASAFTKIAVARGRPSSGVQLLRETDFSYPSGHVTAVTALVCALIFVTFKTRPPWWTRVSGCVAGAAVITAVATSRLYLGVHWLTDVIGGALLGAAVAATIALFTATLLSGAAQHDNRHGARLGRAGHRPTNRGGHHLDAAASDEPALTDRVR